MKNGPDIDLLADYAAGVLDGTPEGAAVAERIAADPAWAESHAALVRADEAVRADLAALPMPKIPDDIAARLDKALEAEATGTVVPLRKRRSWGVAGGAVAAGVAVLAAGALGIQALGGGDSQRDTTSASAPESARDTASQPAGGSARPKAAAPQAPETFSGLTSSGEEYRGGTLREQVARLVNAKARTDASVDKAVPGPLTRLSAPAAFSDCLAALGADARPLAVDYARYDGQPAVIVVLPALENGQVDVAIVGPDCGLRDSDLKHRSNVTL